MSEAEVLEMLNLHAANAMNGFAIYLTLTFAFLTAIYIVGVQLSKLQAVLISALYFAWSTSFSLVAITHLRDIDSLVSEYPDFINTRMWHIPWTAFGCLITIAGILICCGFAYDIRREKKL